MAFFDFIKRKYSLQESGILQGSIDRHSHILFGVDDGIATLEDSLKVLSFLESVGVKELWCTPHIMEDSPNTTEFLRERFHHLQDAYTGNIRLRLAAEYMMDNLLEERFRTGDMLTMEDNTVLVETSTWNPPTNFYQTLRDLQRAGYRPLLAHPERYRYLELKDYEKIIKLGVHLQLNLGSIVDYYGETAAEKAQYLLQKGWYSDIGSDCHRYHTIKEQYSRETLTKEIVSLLRFRPSGL